MPSWRTLDHDAIRRSFAGRCFICGLVAGDPEFAHTVLYRDDVAIAFLSKYPTVSGYMLVAPTDHREHVIRDFSPEDYLSLQQIIYRIGAALVRSVSTERLYIVSVGSQQGNRHVHWHLVPVPPGIPFEQQQYALLDRKEYLCFSAEETEELAQRIEEQLKG